MLEIIETLRRPDESLSQLEIAEICGMTRQRVQQIEAKALVKLRQAAVERGLQWRLADWLAQGRKDAIRVA